MQYVKSSIVKYLSRRQQHFKNLENQEKSRKYFNEYGFIHIWNEKYPKQCIKYVKILYVIST